MKRNANAILFTASSTLDVKMDKPHSEQMDNGLLFELQQQNEFFKRQLACSEAANT
jgi:hypothetical protein